MKNIPIMILNKDRLDPLKQLIGSLQIRGYTNIAVIDNKSTYPPLLEWYEHSAKTITIFHNRVDATFYDNSTFYRLAAESQISPFKEIMQNYYINTDSDVVLEDSVPHDFVEHMFEVSQQFPEMDKIGLGLKINDLPYTPHGRGILKTEAPYWMSKIPHDNYELYRAPVDTTFALYGPNKPALWSEKSIRMCGKYLIRHLPWYYDNDNLPPDELHYIKNLEDKKGPAYSWRVKTELQGAGKL